MSQAVSMSTPSNAIVPRRRSPQIQLLQRVARNLPALLGAAVIFGVIIVAIFAPVIARYPYDQNDLSAVEQAPSAAHWFGTDALGRDMFSRVVWGARSAVFVVLMVSIVDLVLGIPFGAAAGYLGGWVDTLVMRVADILFAFPGLLFVFFIAATIKPGILNWAKSVGLSDLARSGYLDYAVVIIALGVIGWAGLARMVRGQVLAVKEREFVISARAIGVPTWKVIMRHVLLNSLAPVIVALSMGMGYKLCKPLPFIPRRAYLRIRIAEPFEGCSDELVCRCHFVPRALAIEGPAIHSRSPFVILRLHEFEPPVYKR